MSFDSGDVPHGRQRRMRTITVAWTSSAGGAATQALTFRGLLYGVYTTPGSGGSQPTNLYDVTLVDSGSHDKLGGNGANRSNTATEWAEGQSYPMVISQDTTLTIANAGDTKSGTVTIEYEAR